MSVLFEHYTVHFNNTVIILVINRDTKFSFGYIPSEKSLNSLCDRVSSHIPVFDSG